METTNEQEKSMDEITTPETTPQPMDQTQLLNVATEKIKADRSNTFRHRASMGAVAGIASVAVTMLVEKMFNSRLNNSSRRAAKQAVQTIPPAPVTEVPTVTDNPNVG